ncbi:hypothetical protein A20C1_00365 [marine actinobacterium PHSC20C1]|nr:hypothetical protein A20C1_00365 [marine actinobacterium PHSC20C1]
MTEGIYFVQAWLIAAVVTYGLLSFTPWRRNTRLVLAVLVPAALIMLIAWFFLRGFGGGAGRED